MIPCISFFNGKLSANSIIPAITGIYTNKLKKSDKDEFSCISFMYPDNSPAALFPIADAKNQMPNKTPKYLFGESLFTYDSPTGERHNSPNVCIKYARVRNIILAL